MKYIVTVLFVAITLASCAQKENHFATITGQFKGKKVDVKEIHLCKVEHGSKTKVATSQISENGSFGFNQPIEESGLYVVNVVWSESQRKHQHDHDLKRLYLERGTMVNMELKEGSYELLETNNDKNTLLKEWSSQVDTLFTISHGFMGSKKITTYKDYFPLLPEYEKKMRAFQNSVNTGDAKLDELLRLMAETDLAASAFRLLQTPRVEHPKAEDYPEYYKQVIKNLSPKSERLLELSNGRDFVNSYVTYAVLRQEVKPGKDEFVKFSLQLIPNDLLKGYFALDNARRFRAFDTKYLTFKAMVEPYLQNDYLLEEFKKFEMSIRKYEMGALAFDFSGKDVNGKKHNLSDYKGKLVYVDVWATWCGPCKAQIPALKKLEKKFHGKPIAFLSISLDRQKDLQKWKDFIKEKNLGGVQLIADKAFDSDVAKAYEIKGIPRFMLFDKEGKVITIDAPRPSEEKTEKWLLKNL